MNVRFDSVWTVLVLCAAWLCGLPSAGGAGHAAAADLNILFLGDNGHHRPAARFQELAAALEPRGIQLTYTDRMEDLAPRTLDGFDGLLLYANIDRIEDDQARAVLDFVTAGGGFIPLHCATYCWRNNREMVSLMGAQFQRHGAGVFTTRIAAPDHAIMKHYSSFTSWDETYIHHLHNEQNRTVLEYRVEGEQAEGRRREPWTWIRTHGQGRVFYTAWGHDQRTFTHPGFHNLVERGIRWACGDDPGKVPAFHAPESFVVPHMTPLAEDRPAFEYVDVGPKIPNYTPGARWGVQGEPHNRMQKPLSAAASMRHFVTPAGMAVRRYADERSFQAKPIAMTWDERGRLWVCETVDYPNRLGSNRDRIRICEDTDGDHVADAFTVFAEGLSIPTAIVIVRGGAVVQNGTETIYLKDTDGDDVADRKTVLIDNWALGDTHGGVSNFRYGLDNWIWAMQGYNRSTPRVDGEPTQTFRMGFWRFKLSQTDPPRVTDLEFIRSTNNNTWGLGISEEGLVFGSTANRNPSVFAPIPNRYYERVRGWSPPPPGSIADTHRFRPITENVRQVDQFGGYTAAAGHALYTARAFPRQWWNKTAFVCGPTGHLVGTFVLRRDGANFASTSPVNLLASDDEWCAPIMAEVGPDGAVWVIDWYNYIVQHNPTPHGFKTGKGNAYESELRDKRHGRIYRVVAASDAGDVLHAYTSLAGASPTRLVQTLKHPSLVWRLHAQRLLIEQRPGAVPAELAALIADTAVDAVGLNVGAIHALWTLDGLGLLDPSGRLHREGRLQAVLGAALDHPSAGVRRNGLAVLPRDSLGRRLLLERRGLFSDPDAQVRLAALLALADLPASDETGRLVAEMARQLDDPVLYDGLTAAAAAHDLSFLKALAARREARYSDAELQLARRIAEHVGRGRPDAHQLNTVLATLRRTAAPLVPAVLDGLTSGLPADFEVEVTERLDATLVAILERAAPPTKGKVVRLAVQCGTSALDAYAEQIVASLALVLGDRGAEDAERVAAARDLVGFRADDADAAARILRQIDAQTPPALARQFLRAVEQSKSAAAGDVLVRAAPTLTPQLASAAIATLLSRPAWVESLLDGLDSGTIAWSDLALDQQQALRAFPDAKIRARAERLLSKRGGLPDADRDKVLRSLLHLTEKQGDVDAGREMFKKHCAACHRHGEMGKAIAPNLTGMAVHPKAELLTHIIDPSRSVEGNFRIYTVVTTDGRVVNGMLASETRTSITLIDAKAHEIGIQREDIDELLASRKSLMPEGFEKQMSEAEMVHLLEFLSHKAV